MNDTQRLKALDALYATIPATPCTGACARQCGPIFMSRLEAKRICERTGLKPEDLDFATVLHSEDRLCPLLDRQTKRCTAYDIRPAVCRLFGSCENRPCPHGCKAGHPMSEEAAHALIDATGRLGHGFPANYTKFQDAIYA